jgi:hypothetical protein
MTGSKLSSTYEGLRVWCNRIKVLILVDGWKSKDESG